MTKFLMGIMYAIGSMLGSVPKKETNNTLMPAMACGSLSAYDPCDPYAFDVLDNIDELDIKRDEPLYIDESVQEEEDYYFYSDPSSY